MTCDNFSFFRPFLKGTVSFLLGTYITCAGGAYAAPSSPPVQNNTALTHLHYAVFVRGYHAANADADYALQSWGYGGTTHIYTVGMASWFLTIDLTSTVEGRFNNDKAVPISFDNKGYSRDAQRHAHLDFDLTGPHVTVLTPKEENRETIPDSQQKNSIDILSALGQLMHQLDVKKTCVSSGYIFDGVRMTYIDAHGPRIENVPDEHHPFYTGSALRCDFTGQQTSGFVVNSPHKQAQATPRPGAAWFTTVEGIGLIPVRVEFQHPKLGNFLMILQQPPQKIHSDHS